MPCEIQAEDLSAFADGELTVEAASRVEAHLGACADCRKRLDELKALWSVLGSDLDTEPSPHFVEGVWARIRALRRAAPGRRAVLQTVAALAASVLLLLGLMFMGNREMSEPGDPPPATNGGAPAKAFTEVEDAVREDPELLEILNHLDALNEIELLETLPLLEALEDVEASADDDLTEAAGLLALDPEVPLETGQEKD
jgi:hypothetical protein